MASGTTVALGHGSRRRLRRLLTMRFRVCVGDGAICAVASSAKLKEHHDNQQNLGGNSMSLNRRTVLKGALSSSVATSALKVPAAVAQAGPIKVGFLTVKSGALASGGLQMEQGMLTFFKERNNMLAGRPIELQTADTGGNPAQARTKTQELVERFNVHCLIGPLAAFEALAIDDYIRSSKTPILTVAGAEDMTQRKANPWLVRPSSTSAQCSYPMADYSFKEMKH